MTDLLKDYGLHSAYLSWVDDAGMQNRLIFDVVENEDWDEGATVTEHPVETGANIADHVRVALVKCRLAVHSSAAPIDENAFDQAATVSVALDVPSPSPGPIASGLITVPQYVNQVDLKVLAGTLGGFLAGTAGNAVGGTGGQILGELLVAAEIAAVNAIFPGYSVNVPTPTDAGLVPAAPPPAPQPTVQTWSTSTDYVEAMHAQLVQLKDSAQVIDVFGSKRVCFSMVIEELTFSRNADTGTGEDIVIGLKELRVVSTKVVPAPIPHLSAGGGTPTVNKGEQNPKDAAPAQMKSVFKAIVTSPSLPLPSIASMFGH